MDFDSGRLGVGPSWPHVRLLRELLPDSAERCFAAGLRSLQPSAGLSRAPAESDPRGGGPAGYVIRVCEMTPSEPETKPASVPTRATLHHGMGRRVDLEPDNVAQLRHELGVIREFQAAVAVLARGRTPPRCAAPRKC